LRNFTRLGIIGISHLTSVSNASSQKARCKHRR
jgi:hypothetical protein